ncbi:MAG: hypothetical protein ACUVT7_07180 [Thermoplasmata archaeon]
MRLLRFRCNGCGLQIALETKPERCFCCGSTEIVREGWKQRYLGIRDRQTRKEMMR